MQFTETMAAVEAILFVSGDPVNVEALAHSMNLTTGEMENVLTDMARSYVEDGRGVRLNRSGAEAYLGVDPARAPRVETFLQPLKKQPLTQAVMETLSVIAYRQPATRAEIEAVRGVKCDYSVQLLLKRGLIEEAGRLDLPGRPVSFRTTDTFLRVFGLSSLADLPPVHSDAPADDPTESEG